MKRLGILILLSLFLTLPLVAKTYKIEPEDSSIRFSVPYLGLTSVHGAFEKFKGKIVTDDEGKIQSMSGRIRVSSLHTGNKKRDEYILSSKVLNEKKNKYIRFKTLRVKEDGAQRILVGIVDINGVSSMVEMPLTQTGPVRDLKGKKRIGVTTTIELDRLLFKVMDNPLADDVPAIGNLVEVNLDIQAK
jgi:polyisoprenoid-binding protein YceI